MGVAPAPVAIETSFSQATKKSIIDLFADLMLRLRTLNPWQVLALFKLFALTRADLHIKISDTIIYLVKLLR